MARTAKSQMNAAQTPERTAITIRTLPIRPEGQPDKGTGHDEETWPDRSYNSGCGAACGLWTAVADQRDGQQRRNGTRRRNQQQLGDAHFDLAASSVQPATPPSVHFNLIAFSRPGWYATMGDVIATTLFAGPYADQASCDADVVREHSLGDTTHYDCQLLRNGGMTTVPLGPASGAQPASASSVRFGATDFSRPGWYVEMDEMPGAALFGGPYADQASCNTAVVRDRSAGDTGHYNCQFVSSAP